jgi:hypothetical protein
MMILGFLWYGPLFGKTWLQAIGKVARGVGRCSRADDPFHGRSNRRVARAGLASGIAFPDIWTGAIYGLVIAIAFVTTNALTTAAFESRPSTLTTLGVTYQIVGLTMMGAILGAWR